MKNLKGKKIWWALGLIWVFVVFYLSLTPSPPEVDLGSFPSDKLGHLLAYAFLVFWFIQLLPKSRHFIVLGIFILQGVLLEFIQQQLGYRAFEVADMVANNLGALISYALFTSRDQVFLALENKWGKRIYHD